MFENLKLTEQKYNEISEKLVDPAVIMDSAQYTKLMKEYKNLTPLIEKYREYSSAEKAAEEAKEMLKEGGLEHDFKELVQSEYDENKEKTERLAEELRILLIPKDPNDV